MPCTCSFNVVLYYGVHSLFLLIHKVLGAETRKFFWAGVFYLLCTECSAWRSCIGWAISACSKALMLFLTPFVYWRLWVHQWLPTGTDCLLPAILEPLICRIYWKYILLSLYLLTSKVALQSLPRPPHALLKRYPEDSEDAGGSHWADRSWAVHFNICVEKVSHSSLVEQCRCYHFHKDTVLCCCCFFVHEHNWNVIFLQNNSNLLEITVCCFLQGVQLFILKFLRLGIN